VLTVLSGKWSPMIRRSTLLHIQGAFSVLNTVAARAPYWYNPQRHDTNNKRHWTNQRQVVLNECRIWSARFLPTGVIRWPRSATPDPVIRKWFQSLSLQNWFHTLRSSTPMLRALSLHKPHGDVTNRPKCSIWRQEGQATRCLHFLNLWHCIEMRD
jgi:hypothetical protein